MKRVIVRRKRVVEDYKFNPAYPHRLRKRTRCTSRKGYYPAGELGNYYSTADSHGTFIAESGGVLFKLPVSAVKPVKNIEVVTTREHAHRKADHLIYGKPKRVIKRVRKVRRLTRNKG